MLIYKIMYNFSAECTRKLLIWGKGNYIYILLYIYWRSTLYLYIIYWALYIWTSVTTSTPLKSWYPLQGPIYDHKSVWDVSPIWIIYRILSTGAIKSIRF